MEDSDTDTDSEFEFETPPYSPQQHRRSIELEIQTLKEEIEHLELHNRELQERLSGAQ